MHLLTVSAKAADSLCRAVEATQSLPTSPRLQDHHIPVLQLTLNAQGKPVAKMVVVGTYVPPNPNTTEIPSIYYSV